MSEDDRHFDPAMAGRLLAPERDAWARPAELVEAAGVRPGQTWLDVGCGPGYFGLHLAAVLGPEGRLTCLDDTAEMLAKARDTLAGFPAVSYVQAPAEAPGLDDDSFDGVFCAFVWHELGDRAAAAREFRRLLRPGGIIAIVDWRRVEPPPGPPLDHRLAEAEFLEPLLAAGLEAASDRSFSPYFQLVTAQV